MEDFIPYPKPKKGSFLIESDPAEYNEKGWAQVPVSAIIIGETDDCYVTRILDYYYDEWVGDLKETVTGKICLGYHKTRLIKWEAIQLSIFD
jgi:hypothetical protein